MAGVTNTQLFNAITDLRKELKSDIKDVQDDVSDLVAKRGELSERVSKVETRTDNLNKRVSFWDAGNSVGVVIAGVLAYLGIRT